jgi:hypothetical protein
MTRIYGFVHRLASISPPSIRALARRYVSASGYDLWMARREDPYIIEQEYHHPGSRYRLGIFREFYHYHTNYMAACREIGVSYQILDVTGDDWIRRIRQTDCDAYLVWPSAMTPVWKEMLDDRMRLVEQELRRILYPTAKEIWLYENKRRTRDWLVANGVPHPRTWIFYNRDEAEAFLKTANLPLVLKTNCGAGASGVYILRNRREAARMVHKAFSTGIATRRNTRNRHWGSVFLQEFLPEVREWRMIRIGRSYFGYLKGRVGDFHSGTHLKGWGAPPRPLLDMLRAVTDIGSFSSMNVDIFETPDGRLLVNELHTVFGQSTREQMRVEGRPGRYLFDDRRNAWVFEEGDFARNACSNLRVEYVLYSILGKEAPKPCPRV